MGFALSPMQLTSQSFEAGGAIAERHTKEGGNVSPQLSWNDAPQGTQSFALVCHDPDAPLVSANGTYGFAHWVLYNLPADTTELEENSSAGTSGQNDFGEAGWGGPMPPPGHGNHHYFFFVLALDSELQLEPGLTMSALLEKIEPHVIGMNRLHGTYQR